MKKNILFLHRLWPFYGGGETVTICLANELAKRNYNVIIVYFIDSVCIKDLLFIDSRINAIKITNMSDYNEFASEYCISKKKVKYVIEELRKIIINNRIDIVINQWWPADFCSNREIGDLAKVIKCLHMDPDTKSIYTGISLKSLIIKISYPIFRFLEKEKHLHNVDKHIQNSDKFIFLSSYFQEKYLRLRGNKYKDKLDFVYNPLVYNEFISEELLSEKRKEVLFVGRLLEKHKQVSRILKIWECFYKKTNENEWILTIVGDGPDFDLYKTIVASRNILNVHFEGFQNPLPYYQRASIFVMTSAYEGWPMTLVEAQQYGVVPIVMDSYASLHNIIEDDKNGVIVPDGDVVLFAEKLKNLAENEKMRLDLAMSGLESSRRFKIENIVDKWENIFELI
jgi:glycosyltransferase involved in cell wall biosynthesis